MPAVPGSALVQGLDACDDRDGERVEIEGRVRYAAPVDEYRGAAGPEDEWPRQAEIVADRPDQQSSPTFVRPNISISVRSITATGRGVSAACAAANAMITTMAGPRAAAARNL